MVSQGLLLLHGLSFDQESSNRETSSTSLPESVSFSRVIDLSHTLHPDFPAWFVAGQEVTTRGKRTFIPESIVEVRPVFEWNPDKVNLKQITLLGNVGTHMDGPAIFLREVQWMRYRLRIWFFP